MPYIQRWVNPPKFLQYKGVTVYRTFKNDDCENSPPRMYWFTTNRMSEEGGEKSDQFDVRDLDIDKRLEKEHPPRLESDIDPYKTNDAYSNATQEEQEKMIAALREWGMHTEPKIIKEIIKKAIDDGRLVAWAGDAD